jgi:hypothetical protein
MLRHDREPSLPVDTGVRGTHARLCDDIAGWRNERRAGQHLEDLRNSHAQGFPDIRTFFWTNEQPVFFVGPTAFNLLGIDRWVRNFEHVVDYDSWDSGHARVLAPRNRPYVEFSSSEEINNYLLRDLEVRAFMESRIKH